MVKKNLILLSMIILGLYNVLAQEVTLVTSGEGMTKAEATAAALRSAIEQSFETFVSANTTILNDDIVKDEVATVTSGNIKSYKELSCTKDHQGVYTVSVSATVSLGKLIEYAKSHGSSAEFAGQTFAMNQKMRALNKKNEQDALNNLIAQLKCLQNDIFNYNIKVLEPKHSKTNNLWGVNVNLTVTPSKNYTSFLNIIKETLSSLSLNKSEILSYEQNNIPVTPLVVIYSGDTYVLRNSRDAVKKFMWDICDILNDAQMSCMIREQGGTGRKRFPLYGNITLCDVFEYNTTERSWENNSYSEKNKIGHLYIGFKGMQIQGIPADANLFAETNLKFEYSEDELARVNGYEVVKYPLVSIDDKKNRFKIIADQIGFPYNMEESTVRISGTKGRFLPGVKIVIDINSSVIKARFPVLEKITQLTEHNENLLLSTDGNYKLWFSKDIIKDSESDVYKYQK